MKKNTKQLALAGIFAGLGVVILLLGALLQVLDLSAAALVALLIAVAVLELSPIYPPLIYVATGLLSLVLLPDKLAAVVYLTITGYYPIVKRYFERLPVWLSWVLKFVLFNLALTAPLGVGVWLLSLDLSFTGTRLEGYGAFALGAVYLVGNVVFLLFDIVLTRFSRLYLSRWRRRLGIDKYFE